MVALKQVVTSYKTIQLDMIFYILLTSSCMEHATKQAVQPHVSLSKHQNFPLPRNAITTGQRPLRKGFHKP